MGPQKRYLKTKNVSKVTFCLPAEAAPEAQSVFLVGDFNGWDPASTPGDEVAPGLWRASLPLPRTGVHRYKFVVDGTRWVEDPANMRREPDGHGGTNAVVEVGGPA